MKLALRDEHDWECLGGGGGMEVWGCRRCKSRRFPSIFGMLGTLWSPLLWRNRCPR